MSGSLQGKVAVITGGAQGIARASACALAREGASVMLLDINGPGAAETANTISDAGGTALSRRCDVTVRAEVNDAIDATVAAWGTVDICVAAAMAIKIAPLEEQTEDDLMNVVRVNLLGTFTLIQACFPYLKQRGGKIITFASGSGTIGNPTHSTYAMAKEAVRGLTKAAANEWGVHGITANAIMPVATTPGFDHAMAFKSDGARQAIADRIPLRRLGDPERDIAPVVVFLAGPGSDYITGRSIFVDGGQGSFM